MAEKNKLVERVVFLDLIRGIAAFLVVISHLLQWVIPNFQFDHYEYFNLGQVGVAAFFLVSGFVIPFSLERYGSVKVFLLNRFFRIYPLYVVVFVLSVVLLWFNIGGNWLFLKGKILQNIIYHIFFIQDYLPADKFGVVSLVAGAWTLFLEIIWYFTFAGIFLLGINKKSTTLLLGANLFLFSLSIVSLFVNLRIPLGRPVLLFCCFEGLFLYRYFNNEVTQKQLMVIMPISLINMFFALYVGFGFYTNSHYSLLCVLLSYIAGFALFAFFFVTNGRINKRIEGFFAFLGRISYSFYLSHSLVIELIGHIWGKSGWANFIFAIVFSILLAYLLFKYIEQPGIVLGKKVIKKVIFPPK